MPPRVARLHLRTTHKGIDHVAIENWCLREEPDGWAGVGWGLWDQAFDGIGWQEYAAERERRREDLNDSVKRLHDSRSRSLVWTRRRDSSYWLGQLTGEWQYRDDDEAHAVDMFNVRPCRWREVGTQDAVPGIIVSNFNRSKTLNPVANRAAILYSERIYRQLTGELDQGAPAPDPRDVVESLLGALDLEDLVAAYLQDAHDFVLVSRGSSTVGYEYVLRNRRTGRRAVATVKSAREPVDLDALPSDPDVDVWAYAVSGHAVGRDRSGVRWISTEDLIDFMTRRRLILPDQVQRWLSG